MNMLVLLAQENIAARHDPTWMYSTLAQAAGALVGLLGAVLISRVISHMTALQPNVTDIRKVIHSVLDHANGNHSTIVPRLKETSFGPEGMDWYALLAESYRRLLEQFTGTVIREELPNYVTLLCKCVDAYPVPATESLNSNDMRGSIKGNIAQLEQLQIKLAALDTQLVPRSLWVVFLLLAFLSVVGVAWPLVGLAILTDDTSWHMSSLIVCFVTGTIALVAYFFYLLRELRVVGKFYWRPLG